GYLGPRFLLRSSPSCLPGKRSPVNWQILQIPASSSSENFLSWPVSMTMVGTFGSGSLGEERKYEFIGKVESTQGVCENASVSRRLCALGVCGNA
ncbi:unnamed protein product, partial [Linum tenue]